MFLTFIFLIFRLLQPFSLPYRFISPLLLQSFSLPYLFISPLPSTLISFFLFPFIFLYFCLFLFTLSYYKFVTISSILYIVFPHKKKVPSLSLSKFFGGFFIFFSNFLIIVFNIYFFNIFTSPTFLSPLSFHLPTTSSIFLPSLPFHLPTTFYINIIFPLSLHLPLFLSLLIHTLLL